MQDEQAKQNIEAKKIIGIIAGVLVGAVILIAIIFPLRYFITNNHIQTPITPSQNTTFNTPQPTNSTNVLEKVGTENIYHQELDAEYADYPFPPSSSITKQLLAKIAKDSIILQAGQTDKLITLDPSTFNSPNVDYSKRIQLVSQVKDAVNARINKITGSVISIWFDNTAPGPAGYAKGQQIASSAIQQLYNQVKNKTISMDQAASEIINNSTLTQVDPQYKANAIIHFSAVTDDNITFDPIFNSMIRQLSPGQLTTLYLAKDTDNSKKKIDAVYMFAQVDTKKTDGQNGSFDQWYQQQQSLYEITTY